MIHYENEILMRQQEMKKEENNKLERILEKLDSRFGTNFASCVPALDMVISLLANPSYLKYSTSLVNLLKIEKVSEKTIIFHLVRYFNQAAPSMKKILEKTYQYLPYFISLTSKNGIYEWETSQGVLKFKTFDQQLEKKSQASKLKEYTIKFEMLRKKDCSKKEEDLEKILLLQKERDSIFLQQDAYKLLNQFSQQSFDAVAFFHGFYPKSYITVFEKSRVFDSPEFYSCLTTKNNKTVYDISSNTIYLEECFSKVFSPKEIYKIPSTKYPDKIMEYKKRYHPNSYREPNVLNLALAPDNVAKIDERNFYLENEKGLTK